MLKLGWQFVACPNKFWVRLMRVKYGCGIQVVLKMIHGSITSHILRVISQIWSNVECNTSWTCELTKIPALER